MRKIVDVLVAIGKVCKGAAAKVIALVATMAMVGAVAGVSATAVAQDLTSGDDASVQTDAGIDTQAGDTTAQDDQSATADGATTGEAAADDMTVADDKAAGDTTAQQSDTAQGEAANKEAAAETLALKPEAQAVDDAEDLGAPTHRKYIKYNNDGTYWLSLDVTGASRASTEEKHQPVDVVLVMDSSGSMASCTDARQDHQGNYYCAAYASPSRWDIATSAATTLAQELLTSENAALPEAEQVKMSVVDFDTTSTIKRFGQSSWTTSAQDVVDSFGTMDATYTNGGGTNWEAALSNANSLSSNRAGTKKYIIFVSDGTPTYRNSSMGINCRQSSSDECKSYSSDGVYGNGQNDNNGRNYNAAVNVASNRSGATLYAVSTGSEANAKMEQFAKEIQPAGTFFDGTDADKLAAAFDSIVEEINKNSTYQDVLIKDTLSGYAVSTDAQGGTGFVTSASARDQDGTDVSKTDPAATKMHVDYNQTSKQLSLSFDEGTKLSPDVTYTVSILLKPSDDAYQYFIEHSGQYPDTGDQGTDAEGNDTSSGKPGFFSNAENQANVYYKVVTNVNGQETVGEQQSSAYDRPVIQVKVPSLTLTKGVDNANAGKYGADASEWKLSALKNNGAYGINPTNPSGEAVADGSVSKKSVAKTLLAPGTYTLSEAADSASGYQYFGGYTEGDWSCVDANGNTVKVTKKTDGTQTMNLAQGTDVTCTVVNTAKPGSIAWQKVAANDMNKTLKDSEWKLTSTDVSGFADMTVVDDGDNDAAASQPGSLKVTGLKWGEYTLEETKAPAGYQPSNKTYTVTVLPAGDATADAEFTVDAVEGGKITNKLVAVSSLPLTGGTTGRDWLIYGGGMGLAALLAGAGYTIWRKRQLV